MFGEKIPGPTRVYTKEVTFDIADSDPRDNL